MAAAGGIRISYTEVDEVTGHIESWKEYLIGDSDSEKLFERLKKDTFRILTDAESIEEDIFEFEEDSEFTQEDLQNALNGQTVYRTIEIDCYLDCDQPDATIKIVTSDGTFFYIICPNGRFISGLLFKTFGRVDY